MSWHHNAARLQVAADIQLEIDDRPALLTGQGNQLQLILEDDRTLDALAGSSPRLAGKLADFLAGSGLTLTVVDQHGLLLTAGQGESSIVSRWVTGSRHITLAGVPAFLKLLQRYFRNRIRA